MKKIILTPFLLFLVISPALAQNNQKITSLSKKIMECQNCDMARVALEELKSVYFQEDRYSGFATFLKSLLLKKEGLKLCINYYLALTRHSQLKFLEEKQSWDEYFSQGNDYRQELTEAADKVIAATPPTDPLAVYTRLILWEFHSNQQDVFAEESLTNLLGAVEEYAKVAKDSQPIKEAADKLAASAEKGRAKGLYRLYANKIIASEVKDEELLSIASNFYKEGNLELAETIYDAYIQRVSSTIPKDKLMSLLTDIAKSFVYKGQGPSDPLYAEKIFQKLEELGGKECFSEELIYQRALNLEKAKEYQPASKFYFQLLGLNAESAHSPEVNFKLGIIHVYVLRDLEMGKGYFEKLAQKEEVNPYTLGGLYQLGLLSQWQENTAAAKEYYNKLLEKAGDGAVEIKAGAEERIKEIEEGRPLEYNLKLFLDLSLKEENASFDMSKVELKSQPSISLKDTEINLSSSSPLQQSGCMQVELSYLWSGNTGSKKPANSEAEFSTTFSEPGTKVVNLVVVSPSGGVTDRNLELVDIK